MNRLPWDGNICVNPTLFLINKNAIPASVRLAWWFSLPLFTISIFKAIKLLKLLPFLQTVG